MRWWREEARRRGRPSDSSDDAAIDAAAPIRTEIDRIDLERAFASLPGGYREAILLHDVEGYTHEEIAEMLGVDIGTSKSQLSRVRRALRVRLTGRRA